MNYRLYRVEYNKKILCLQVMISEMIEKIYVLKITTEEDFTKYISSLISNLHNQMGTK